MSIIDAVFDAIGCGKRKRESEDVGRPTKRPRKAPGFLIKGNWSVEQASTFPEVLTLGQRDHVEILDKSKFTSVGNLVSQLEKEQRDESAVGTLRCHQLGECIMWSESKSDWFHVYRSDESRNVDQRQRTIRDDIKKRKLEKIVEWSRSTPSSSSSVALAKWTGLTLQFDADSTDEDIAKFAEAYKVHKLDSSFSSVEALVRQLSDEHAAGSNAEQTLTAHIHGEVLIFSRSTRTWYLLFRSDMQAQADDQVDKWRSSAVERSNAAKKAEFVKRIQQEIKDAQERYGEKDGQYSPSFGERCCVVCGHYQNQKSGGECAWSEASYDYLGRLQRGACDYS